MLLGALEFTEECCPWMSHLELRRAGWSGGASSPCMRSIPSSADRCPIVVFCSLFCMCPASSPLGDSPGPCLADVDDSVTCLGAAWVNVVD